MKKDFDYSKTYYKVTNHLERHHGFQYRDGLNILDGRFNGNSRHHCVAGRLYFTDYEHLPEFLYCGVYIREVTIPENAKVVKDGDNKWGANKIILGKRYSIINDFDKWFDKKRYNYAEYSWALPQYCSQHFDKWYDENLYDYQRDFIELAKYCSEHFDKWFKRDKCDYKLYSKYLAEYCSKHFDKWFDEDLFNYNNGLPALFRNCMDHFDVWSKKV